MNEQLVLNLFDIQTDSFEENILNEKDTKPNKRFILEFTINLPHDKMRRLSRDKQQERLERTMRAGIRDLPTNGEPVHYLELCRDGVLHLHGKVDLKGKYYIEGVVKSFVQNALKSYDGRLKVRENEYYHYLERYRSPMVCVQHTDDPDRIIYWQQYITKCVQN